MKRPPPGLRVAILVAAVACLGLTMCARTAKPPPPPANKPAQQQQQPAKPEEGQMAKQKPTYFPATKAPGGI
jgi:hypothetical protein